MLERLVLAIGLLAWPALSAAAQCAAASGPVRVPLLELYTSEGCDSCPQADRWVSALPARGLTAERVVTLAFHVDYWNYLGWSDPYARAEFTGRQRAAARRNAAKFVYTPQLLLNGKDYRRGMLRDDFAERVAAVNRGEPPASIRLGVSDGETVLAARGEAAVAEAARRPGAAAYLALYENRLATQVVAGENRGRRLEHDYVVRELAGPFAADASGTWRFEHRFRLERAWKRADLQVAAFVQNEMSGEVLQALALVLGSCPQPGLSAVGAGRGDRSDTSSA